MTPQTIEALVIAGFALLAAVLIGIRVGLPRRPSGPPVQVLGPGDAWAAKGKRR